MDFARRLEQAQRLMEEGRPAAALRLLAGRWPGALSTEAAFLRAEALRGQGYFRRAAQLYQALLAGGQADPALAIEAGLGLASVHRSLGEVAAARARLRRAWAAAKRRGEPAWRFELEEAMIERAAGRWAGCLLKLTRLLRRACGAGDWQAAAFLLWARGGARRFSGDLAGAEGDFKRSLTMAGRAGDASASAYALFGLGGVSRIQGRLRDSERFYARAGRALAGADDLFGRAYAHCGLANALRQQGRLSEAQRLYLRAHVLYSKLGDAVDLAYVDWGLGKIALQRGRLPEAVSRLSLALKAFEAASENRGAALSRLALAGARHAQGRGAQAERLFDSGLRRSRRAGLHAHLESYT
ncbi:MAG: tetratricopeptide repeat protein [Elusimicrobia bacterium]|nr:tetratricopeptide repeat protein [Elusimicrobiota bacterium]MDE2424897.1 tetratricopeptide repeat protein [Elusimicrobiota bacterium]